MEDPQYPGLGSILKAVLFAPPSIVAVVMALKLGATLVFMTMRDPDESAVFAHRYSRED